FDNPTTDPNSGEIRSWQHGPISGDVTGLIAPFWSDVWTGTAPTLSPGGNSTGSNHVYWDVDVATQTLTVTWDDVGSFFSGNTPNAFQLQLIDTGNGDFDVVFRYENIDWADS